jgi:hypothetical protein
MHFLHAASWFLKRPVVHMVVAFSSMSAAASSARSQRTSGRQIWIRAAAHSCDEQPVEQLSDLTTGGLGLKYLRAMVPRCILAGTTDSLTRARVASPLRESIIAVSESQSDLHTSGDPLDVFAFHARVARRQSFGRSESAFHAVRKATLGGLVFVPLALLGWLVVSI